MKTTYITLIILLASLTINAQTTVLSRTTTPTNYSLSPSNQLSQFASEIIKDKNFDYKEFKREHKNTSYILSGKIISKTDLTKILRKESKKATTVQDLKDTLKVVYPEIYVALSDTEIALLHTKFRQKSLRSYVASLPSVL